MPTFSLARLVRSLPLLALPVLGVACSRHPAANGGPSAATSTAHALPSAAASASAGSSADGAAAYTRYCALCHGKELTGYAADNAPSLVSQTFLASASDDFIANAIRNGRPGTAMGAYGKTRSGPLDENDLRALVAFIRSHGSSPAALPSSSLHGDPVHGAVVYHDECEKCHGTQAERKTALSLLNQELLASASPEFLRYAIVNGRAPTPMPAFGKVLTPQDIEDVLAWLESKKAGPLPHLALEVPKDLPVVLNPKGKPPNFTLREDRFVPADEVKQALAEHRRIVIADARSPADWIDTHIPGAISVPYYQNNELDRIPNDGTWVIAYCACPHHASGALVDALRQRNYKHTAVLDEGILVWKSRGYPVEGTSVANGTVPNSPAPSATPKTAPPSSAAPKTP
jgi:cytochrome c oxidase cbb3-type subunit 3/ubiquinol-cytochrome c reductase cytochrome c subunit